MLRQAAHRLWETIGKADNVAHLGVGVDEFVVPGYAMKLKVITEGVETAAQLAFLQVTVVTKYGAFTSASRCRPSA